MAQLHQVVGAILRDIAQSRVTSDLYSREVSRYYEEDSLLRLFPIPRTEIKEIEVDLNFGVSNVYRDSTRAEDKLVFVSRTIQRYSEKILEQIFESLKGSPYTKIGKNNLWQEMIDKIDSINLRSDLKFKIIDFFESNKERLISEKDQQDNTETNSIVLDLDTEVSKDGIIKIIQTDILSLEQVKQVLDSEELHNSLEYSIDSGLGNLLDAMDKDLNFELEAYAVDITVAAGDLADMPESIISKIKISAEIKNYNWSQVEEKDNQVVRRLIPE